MNLLTLKKNLWPIFAVALPFAYAMVLPPFQAPDEYVHFARSAALSRGNLLVESRGDQIGYQIDCAAEKLLAKTPQGIEFERELKTKYDWNAFWKASDEAATFVGQCFWQIEAGNFPLHIPLLHVPQAAGIFLGRVITTKPAYWFYGGRLMNATVAVAFLALLLMTFSNAISRMILFCTLPMVGHMLGSLTADALPILSAFFLYALTLRSLRTDATQPVEWLQITIAAALLGFGKSVYLPLLLVVFLIPLQTRRRNDWVFSAVCVSMVIFGLAIWNAYIGKEFLKAQTATSQSSKQIAYMLEHPIRSLVALIGGYIGPIKIISVSFFGSFGWLRVFMPIPWYLAYLALTIIWLGNNPEPLPNRLSQLVFPLAALASMMAISLSMYLIFTPVGGSYTLGIQGRYLIPLFPFLVTPILFKERLRKRIQNFQPHIIPILLSLNVYALIITYRAFN